MSRALSIAMLLAVPLTLAGPAHSLDSPPFILQWGSCGIGDGQLGAGDVAVGPDGRVYVADTARSRIQVFSPTGVFLMKWGSQGSGPGQFSQRAQGITVDSDGLVYAVENSRVQVFTGNGSFVREWGSFGSAPGQIKYGYDVAVNSLGYVYVTDYGNYRVSKFTKAGVFVSHWGTFGTSPGQFKGPRGIAIDQLNNVYVGDAGIYRIHMFRSDSMFVRTFGGLDYPLHIGVDRYGHIYTPNYGTHFVDIYDSTGAFRYRWGGLGSAPGQFNGPTAIAFDAQGDIYVSDQDNCRIQKFAGGTVSVPFSLPGSQLSIRVQGSPMNRGQRVRFDIAGLPDQDVYGGIYDVTGRRVSELSGRTGPEGHLILGRSHEELGLAAGLYLLRIDQRGRRATSRLVILD